jgi:uncharacterized protein YsxB (DUF464 family)
MIRVIYDPEAYQVDVSGHAGYAAHGQDVVCAGASTLFYTLARSLRDIDRFDVQESADGSIKRISCVPSQGQAIRARVAFRTIMQGFKMLSEEYPAHVSFTRVKSK